ncbi:tyrosine-type recombinase/integrase [Tolypothrix sp. LEGE 11397]|nr:tyrosine-type recombinase/integrase [Tolypothrix sp. LEGE 11397]
MTNSEQLVIYQLHIFILGISPMIWRRVYIFQSSRRGPLAHDTIAGIVERSGELAGLPLRVHAHMLRHGTGYYLANRGIDIRTIQSYLGHKNIQHK